jgi:energy-coupling factor transporter ATP-binding protein EcfA2
MKLLLENVRSFAGKHQIPLSRLTLLVGENSSGKTTCLASLSAIFGSAGFPVRPAFNEPPFDLGGYDTIATYKGGRSGRAKHFSLGYVADAYGPGGPVEVNATYTSSLGQVTLKSLLLKRDGSSVSLALDGNRVTGRLVLAKEGHVDSADIPIDTELVEGRLLLSGHLGYAIYEALGPQKLKREQMESFTRLVDNLPRYQTVAVAPVRTKPRRTYDPISDEFKPEGDHIPLVLARGLGATASVKAREQLREALTTFGEASGLFTEVKVKSLGKNPSDPFQILVAVSGRPFNLADVGYGISQSLPVIVESTIGGDARLMLLQQPEVHLHPKAQAALGSFFARLVAAQGRTFVIETHSDHLIDRVRQEVARGTLAPELVTLLFFERKHGETKVYSLLLDRHGNITNAPPSYRTFFLQEEEALLKRTQPDLIDLNVPADR